MDPDHMLHKKPTDLYLHQFFFKKKGVSRTSVKLLAKRSEDSSLNRNCISVLHLLILYLPLCHLNQHTCKQKKELFFFQIISFILTLYTSKHPIISSKEV